MSKLRQEIWPYVALAALICCSIFYAWSLRFLQDDAFISFRYAKNLVAGHGLVYNPGEWVEGYSNFLWTLIIALMMWLEFEPGVASYALGIFFFTLNLFAIAGIGRVLRLSYLSIVCTVTAVGLNYSFAAYATGGLETSLHSFFISTLALASLMILERRKQREVRGSLSLVVAMGVVASLALLTRMDSALFVLCFVAPVLYALRSDGRFWAKFALVVGPPLFCLVVWTAWRHGAYGAWLPNTFYVKLASSTSLERGLHFLQLFFTSYLIYLPLVVLLASRLSSKPRGLSLQRDGLEGALFFACGLWLLYVVYAGGDFMEFRILVPIIPFLALLVFGAAERFSISPIRKALMLFTLLLGSLHHQSSFLNRDRSHNVLSIPLLSWQVDDKEAGWSTIGAGLKQLFRGRSDPILAVTAAGALPYYSELSAIDMFGLTDAWVSRNGILVGSTPGHQRFASAEYLRSRKVQLVIPFPITAEKKTATLDSMTALMCKAPFFDLVLSQSAQFPDGARAVLLPISESSGLLAIQFNPEETVDRLVNNGLAPSFPLPSACS